MPSTFDGLPIINDETPNNAFVFPDPRNYGRGLDLSLRTAEGYGANADQFPSELLIPSSEYQARIQERKERKQTIRDLVAYYDWPCKNQAQTNYCWINAPTYLTEVMRLIQGQSPVSLSPASGGAVIKGYQNVGGWGNEALKFISNTGLVPSSNWPDAAINRQYKTPETDAMRASYRVTEWWELTPRNMNQLVSALLRNIPVAVGYNWWAHEVSIEDVDWVDGTIALVMRNSWGMSWGTKGYSILQGNKMVADDAVCPRVAVAA
jgi:hypothetical protein